MNAVFQMGFGFRQTPKNKILVTFQSQPLFEILFGSEQLQIRYDIDSLCAMNFVLDKTLGGGVTRSLAIDKHGKALGMALMEMEI